MRVQHIDAMNIIFEFLTTNLGLVNIGVMDIVDGNAKMTLGLLWHIMVFFLLRDLGGDSVDLHTFKVVRRRRGAVADDVDGRDETRRIVARRSRSRDGVVTVTPSLSLSRARPPPACATSLRTRTTH